MLPLFSIELRQFAYGVHILANFDAGAPLTVDDGGCTRQIQNLRVLQLYFCDVCAKLDQNRTNAKTVSFKSMTSQRPVQNWRHSPRLQVNEVFVRRWWNELQNTYWKRRRKRKIFGMFSHISTMVAKSYSSRIIVIACQEMHWILGRDLPECHGTELTSERATSNTRNKRVADVCKWNDVWTG